MSRRAIPTLLTLAVLATPAVAAADTVVAPDPDAQQLTALDGTLIWVSGHLQAQTLMQRTASRIARVQGAPRASYRSIDLGHDRRGRLVLTYLRCGRHGCQPRRDDLHGHRARITDLESKRCSISTAPALWGDRAAYGLACHTLRGTRKTVDVKRSGLYVKTGSRAPKRLPLPRDAVKFGVDEVDWVDLRGTRVAAVVADIFQYAFSETVTGTRLHSSLVAASEGDSDQHVRGLSLARGGALWTLVDAEHAGDPNQAIIYRLTGSCVEYEQLVNPAGPDQESGFRAEALAVDGQTVYLAAPDTGIVTHDFEPEHSCGPA